MQGERLSIDELIENPPALPRSSAPPGADSNAPTGRYRVVVDANAVLERAPRPARSRRPRSSRPPTTSLPPLPVRRRPSSYVAFVAWAALLVSIGFFAAAQPPTSWAFFETFGGAVRQTWSGGHLGVSLGAGGLAWSLAAAGLVMDAFDVRARVHGPSAVALALASFLVVCCLMLL